MNHPVRARAIAIVFNPWFDRFIMSLIMLNCLFLAMDSKEPGFAETTRGCVRHPPPENFPIQQPHRATTRTRFASLTLARDRPSQKPRRQTVEGSENVFLALFVMEMCLKIIALGFWWEQHTYLTDNWNRLDSVVVILGIVAAFDLGNFSAIRTVRVLRPLRTLQGFAGMRQLVVTLLKSLPLLMDVGVLVFFLFFLFGLVGVQLFSGALVRRCAVLDNPLTGCELCGTNTTHAVFPGCAASCVLPDVPRWTVPDDSDLCGGPLARRYPARDPYEPAGYKCPLGSFCVDFDSPNHGYTNFDNVLSAWLTIFQCISCWRDGRR